MNCMEVFHYVANALKNVPLFDSDTEAIRRDQSGGGAIYNDFDHCPMELLQANDENMFCFSQTSNIETSEKTSEMSIQEAVDHAVMAEDEAVGVQYEHLAWESAYFDNFSDSCDQPYCEKVHKLVTNFEGCWDALNVTTATETMFERRLRTKWDMPDTVYDAWLIKCGFERPWFDTHLFFDKLCDDLETLPSYQPQNENTTKEGDETKERDTSDSNNKTVSSTDSSSGDNSSDCSSPDDTDVVPVQKKRRRLASESSAGKDIEEGYDSENFLTPVLCSTPTK